MIVDVVGELDEPEAVPEPLTHLPRQVARIDRQAVPSDTGPRGEAHKAERLGARRVDGLPHVDPELVGEDREFVHEGDVHVSEGVLEQLGQLGLASAADGHGRLDQRVVEVAHSL